MAGSPKTAKPGKAGKYSTFRSYLRTRLMASVLVMVAITSASLYYFLNQAFEAQFLARARAEKHLAEEVIKDRIEHIETRLREVANNNTVKITLMLGVKPQLKELLQEICPPATAPTILSGAAPTRNFILKTPRP